MTRDDHKSKKQPTVETLARMEQDALIHRNKFGGSPRKLKGKTFGRWVKVDNKEKYIPGGLMLFPLRSGERVRKESGEQGVIQQVKRRVLIVRLDDGQVVEIDLRNPEGWQYLPTIWEESTWYPLASS